MTIAKKCLILFAICLWFILVNISHKRIILQGRRLRRVMLWMSIKSVARQQNTEVGNLQKVLHSLVKLNADSKKIGPVPKYFSSPFLFMFPLLFQLVLPETRRERLGKLSIIP